MNKESWVILWLSLQLTLTTFAWVRAEKKVSYLEGRAAVYTDIAAMEPDGPYTGGK